MHTFANAELGEQHHCCDCTLRSHLRRVVTRPTAEMAGIFRNFRKMGELVYEYFDFGNKELAIITAKRKQAEQELAKAMKVC